MDAKALLLACNLGRDLLGIRHLRSYAKAMRVLRKIARDNGILITRTRPEDGPINEAYYDYYAIGGPLIYIDKAMPPNRAVTTLIHELGHAVMIQAYKKDPSLFPPGVDLKLLTAEGGPSYLELEVEETAWTIGGLVLDCNNKQFQRTYLKDKHESLVTYYIYWNKLVTLGELRAVASAVGAACRHYYTCQSTS